jgi:anti-sigma factor RsiW
MSLMFTCDDKATLVAYLYNEIDAPDRQRVDDHLLQCAVCAADLAALSGVRGELTQWAAPNVELGFTSDRRDAVQAASAPPATLLRSAPWWNTVPVWAQAVAAILVLAVSAAIANVQVKSGPDGFVVSTGWMAPAAATTVAAPAVAAAADARWQPALIALEQQLRQEIRATRETGTVRAASRSEADEATVRRVRELLEASETRQNRELALRVTQLTRDMDIQRRADLVRIEQGIGHTGVEIAKQRQMLNYVMRASTTPQQ